VAADELEVSGVIFVPICLKAHGSSTSLCALARNSIGCCQNSSLPRRNVAGEPKSNTVVDLDIWCADFAKSHPIARAAVTDRVAVQEPSGKQRARP